MYLPKQKKLTFKKEQQQKINKSMSNLKKIQHQPKINNKNLNNLTTIEDDEFVKKAKSHFKKIRSKFQEYVGIKDQKKTHQHPNQIKPEDIVQYINKVRANPKQMANQIRLQTSYFINKNQIIKNGVTVSCLQGKSAYLEAAEYMETIKPLKPFELNKCLSMVCLDLAIDLIGSEQNSFKGSDNSTSKDRLERRIGTKINEHPRESIFNVGYYQYPGFIKALVMSMIVDQGHPERGWRNFLLSDSYSYMGASMIKNPNQGYKCILNMHKNDITVGIVDEQIFDPKYKTLQQTKKEVMDSMVQQKKYVKQIRTKFQKFTTNIQQIKQVEPLDDFIRASEVLLWLNKARTNPSQFAKYLRQQLKSFIDQLCYKTNNIKVSTKQGKSAIKQAIQFLQKQEPLCQLKLNQCLSLAAADHLMDMIMNNFFQHQSSDGSSLTQRIARRCNNEFLKGSFCENLDRLKPFEGPNYAKQTIIRYIVDDDVPTRGHRKNIFNKQVKFVGICMLKDRKFGYKNVLDFSSVNLECLNKQGGVQQIKYNDNDNENKVNEQKSENETKKNKVNEQKSENETKKNKVNEQKSENETKKINIQIVKKKINSDNNNKLKNLQKSYKNLNKTLNPQIQKRSLQKGSQYSIIQQNSNKNSNYLKTEPNAFNKPKRQIKQQKIIKHNLIEKGIKITRVTKTTKYEDGRILKRVYYI